jgi:hypothetical protein
VSCEAEERALAEEVDLRLTRRWRGYDFDEVSALMAGYGSPWPDLVEKGVALSEDGRTVVGVARGTTWGPGDGWSGDYLERTLRDRGLRRPEEPDHWSRLAMATEYRLTGRLPR